MEAAFVNPDVSKAEEQRQSCWQNVSPRQASQHRRYIHLLLVLQVLLVETESRKRQSSRRNVPMAISVIVSPLISEFSMSSYEKWLLIREINSQTSIMGAMSVSVVTLDCLNSSQHFDMKTV